MNVNVNASIVVMDGDSGRVLYEKNMSERKLIASTTKIMTALVALENAKLSDVYSVGKEIKEVNGSMIYVKEGEKFSLNDLLHGLMLQSGNDAAMIIANNVMNYDNFIAQMNIKAYKLGMYNTYFENPHGLNDDTKNMSTAYDMAKLMLYATNNSDFIKITQTKTYKVGKYIWNNKNKLLFDYKYLISGKIGYTKASGQVFVSSAIKDNKKLVIVSIDEPDKFNLHKKLYEDNFNKYKRYKVLNKKVFAYKLNVNSNDYYYLKRDYYMLLKNDDFSKIKIKVNINNYSNYLNVLFNDKIIHSEKIYKKSYIERKNDLKDLLLFWK